MKLSEKSKRRMTVVFVALCICMMLLFNDSYATQYNWFSSTTAANKEKYFYNVTGTLKKQSLAFSYVKGTIVNQGVDAESFSGRFGTATTPVKPCGQKAYFSSAPYFNDATCKAGIYRNSDGTTMSFEVRALVE